jgi:hypothetical protein
MVLREIMNAHAPVADGTNSSGTWMYQPSVVNFTRNAYFREILGSCI